MNDGNDPLRRDLIRGNVTVGIEAILVNPSPINKS